LRKAVTASSGKFSFARMRMDYAGSSIKG
jgi:hypothetical protein